MEIVDILFYLFSVIIISCAVLTVTLKHVLHAAICLMGCLFMTGALFLLMFAEFVAVMQVLVYVGGVVIFIIYAILLTSDLGEKFAPIPLPKRIMAGTFCFIIAVLTSFILVNYVELSSIPLVDYEDADLTQKRVPNAKSIGIQLLSSKSTGFLIPFEVISMILLAALMASATIARRSKEEEAEARA